MQNSPVIHGTILIVHVHQLQCKLWDVLRSFVRSPMALHIYVVSDVVVVNGVSAKLQAFGTNCRQHLSDDVAHPPWCWIRRFAQLAPASRSHIGT